MPPAPLPTQLDQLCAQLGTMCDTVSTALRRATVALLENRERLATQVIADYRGVQAMRAEAEELATDALLFHQPGAAAARGGAPRPGADGRRRGGPRAQGGRGAAHPQRAAGLPAGPRRRHHG